MEYNHRVWVAEDSSLHKSAVTVLHLVKYYTKRAALTLSQKIFEKCFSKWFHVWNANTVQVRHRFCSVNCKFLSNTGFYLFFIFTRVCLFHTVTVDADLTGVHTTVWLTVWSVHLLKRGFSLGYSASIWWQNKMCFWVQLSSLSCTHDFFFGLPDTIKPLLFVEGVIGLQWMRLALRSMFEADSKEVSDWKKQYIEKCWMIWLNGCCNRI